MLKGVKYAKHLSSTNKNLVGVCCFLTRTSCSKCTERVQQPLCSGIILKNNLEKGNLAMIERQRRSFSMTHSANLNKELTKILARAEKVVGYPTSFLNLRYLVSDEVANFANLLRKLIKTKHPLIKMARSLISNEYGDGNDSKRSLQINGLLVLLISKAAGIPSNSKFIDVELSDGIHNSQRCLAEITEMIYMGSLIHKGLIDVKELSSLELTSMDQGNKLAVLCGDYLLASACNNLSKLQNTEVVDLMSQVIADISQSIFIRELKPKFSFLKQWYESVNSNTTSLLANSAKGSLLLVKHSPKLQHTAWEFAKNLDLTHKVWSDLTDFKNDYKVLNKTETIVNAIYRDKYEKEPIEMDRIEPPTGSSWSTSYSNLISAVYPAFSREQRVVNEILYEKLINECRSIFWKHYNVAFESLNQLENENSEKEAVESLRSILNVMKQTV